MSITEQRGGEQYASFRVESGDRQQRIEQEKFDLEKNLDQRRLNLQTAIWSRSKELSPTIVFEVPNLLFKIQQGDFDFVDLKADDYSHEETLEKLMTFFKEMEKWLVEKDAAFRSILVSAGLEPYKFVLLDEDMFKRVVGIIGQFKSKVESFSNNDPRVDSAKKNMCLRLSRLSLFENFFIPSCMALANESLLQVLNTPIVLPQFESKFNGAEVVKEYIYESQLQGRGQGDTNLTKRSFWKVPRPEEYKGEVLDLDEVDLSDVKMRKTIGFVSKDKKIPTILPYGEDLMTVGFLKLDSNDVGDEDYKKQSGINVIDHHDKLEEKKYDTTTIMVLRKLMTCLNASNKADSQPKDERERWEMGLKKFYEEVSAQLYDPEGTPIRSAAGYDLRKLRVYIDHLDVDSILSVWVAVHPNIAMKYKHIVERVSVCGDFGLGTGDMLYGVTARDYVSIIKTYISTCLEQLKRDKGDELTDADFLLVLNKAMEVLEDIFSNPFKYAKFMEKGNTELKKGIRKYAKAYESPEKGIEVNPRSNEHMVVVSQRGDSNVLRKTKPREALTMFLRSRVDFNEPIVAILDEKENKEINRSQKRCKVIVNIQNGVRLSDYNFRELYDALQAAENRIKSPTQREVRKWKVRTQMVFTDDTLLTDEQMVDIIGDWSRKSFDEKPDASHVAYV